MGLLPALTSIRENAKLIESSCWFVLQSNGTKPLAAKEYIMEKDVIETSKGKLWLVEDSIIFITIKQGAEIDVDDIKEMQKANVKLYSGNKHVICADIRNLKSTTKAARDYAGSLKSAETTSAIALIISSPLSRVMGNFFIRITRPPYPTKLFTDKERALEWLKQFVD